MRNFLILGDWNALCDVCGLKHKASELQKRWDGLMVCQQDYEFRHPQDYLRVQKEQINTPWARPDPTIEGYVCTYVTSQGIAGIGVAGCAITGSVNP